MSKSQSNQETNATWNRLYRMAGAAALLAVLVVLADISLTFLPAGAEPPGTMTAVDWFALYQENWFFGLRNLGLLPNILNLVLLIPVFLALYAAHRQADPVNAALAMVLSFLGTAVYLSNNAAFPMLALSSKYAAATTDAERALLAAAGEAILARGEDFSPGAFIGFLLGELAVIAICLVMLRAGVFSKAAGYTGFIAGLSLAIFTVWVTFIPVFFEAAMLLAMVGGLLSIAWYLLMARRLFQLSQSTPKARSKQNALAPLANS